MLGNVDNVVEQYVVSVLYLEAGAHHLLFYALIPSISSTRNLYTYQPMTSG